MGGGFPCYAYKLANGRLKSRYLANDTVAKKLISPLVDPAKSLGSAIELQKALDDPFFPRFWHNRVVDADRMLKNSKKALGIFDIDMGEWAGDWIPKAWQEWLFELIRRYPQHRHYLLTKQPQNLVKFSPFPENCFVGVTATNPQMFYEAQGYLEKIVATVRFISLEPYLKRIWTPQINAGVLDQLIIGSQTKPYKPPKIADVEEMVRACDKAGVPVFLKDNLKPLLATKECYGEKYTPLPLGNENGGLRQEMPEC